MRIQALVCLAALVMSCSGSKSQPSPARHTPSDSAASTPASNPAQDLPQSPNTCTGATPYPAYVSDARLCVYVFAEGLGAPRQMAFAPNGDLFINNGSVTAIWDSDANATSDKNERATFASAPGLRHGIAFARDGRFVYASSETTIYRWAYEPDLRAAKGAAETVVKGMPSGGHDARTLQFDSKGRLYVTVGSGSNVDDTQDLWSTRSQVRRFTLPATLPQGGVDYASSEIVASGMRNEVGLFVDAQDRVWGVENGRDNLSDADFGGDIHNDNPGEEINLIDGQGSSFYGYPFCYSEFVLSGGKGMATQWADQTLAASVQKTDAFCQNSANVHPPMYAMQAHLAPL
jgi:glucose/arabinose dehydrogenase